MNDSDPQTGPGPADHYGPVDFYVIGLPELRVDDATATAIRHLIGNPAITVVDVVLVSKSQDGTVDGHELSDGVVPGLDTLGDIASALTTEDDVAAVAELLEPGTSALVAVIENTWAREFAATLDRTGAHVLLAERIPAEVVNADAAALAAS